MIILTASPSTLDVDNEELLGVGEDHVGVPPLVGVHSEKVLDDHFQARVAREARPVDVRCEKVISELLFV